MASLDHGAIGISDGDRRYLAGAHRHHRLVEQGDAIGSLAEVDQAPSLTDSSQRDQLGVSEPLADPDGLAEPDVGCRDITREQGTQGGCVPQVALLDTVELAVVEQTLCTVDPTAAASHLTAVQQGEGEPERTACGPGDLTNLRAPVVGAGPGVGALPTAAREVGRRREPLEIVDPERLAACRSREVLVRATPRLAVEAVAAPIDPLAHGQSLIHAHAPRLRMPRPARHSQKDSLPEGAAQIIHRSAIRSPSNW